MMQGDTPKLDAAGLQRFQALRSEAIDIVAQRFHSSFDAIYRTFGERGRQACREDLDHHLDFLRPALEFGRLQPMVDYLRWLAEVLATRDVPADHLPLSLDWLAEFFDARMEREDAQIVVSALLQTKTRFLAQDPGVPAPDEVCRDRWPECDAFEAALLAGDRRGAESLLDQRREGGHDLVDSEMHLIQPALYAIGRKWQDNRVSVAQEHLATALAQSMMTRGLLKSEPRASIGRSVLLACVAGNHHCVGLQMVADAFQLAGWEVQSLGPDVPTDALIGQVSVFKPELLGLSVSFPQQLRVVKEITARLIVLHGAMRPRVVVGGLAINQFPLLAAELGADAWSSNARVAVECATADRDAAAQV